MVGVDGTAINQVVSRRQLKHVLCCLLLNRLTPAYAFILLLHATWLPKLQDGPLWPRGAEVERNFCRRNWWTNLLYVNNYVNADEPVGGDEC